MNGQHRVGEFLQDFKLENKWAEQIYLAVIRAHNKVTAAFTTNTFFTGCFESFAPKVGFDHFSILVRRILMLLWKQKYSLKAFYTDIV